MSDVHTRLLSPAGRDWMAIALVVFLGMLGPAMADAQVRTWISSTGGNWSNPANWDTGVPGPLDNAVIALAGTYTVTLDVNPTVVSLTLGGASGTQTLAANGRTLTLNGASTIGSQGRMTLTSSSVGGTGSLTNNGTLTLSAATINVPLVNNGTTQATGGTAAANNVFGAYTSGAGSSLQVISPLSGGSGILTIAAGFTNQGSIVLSQLGARPTAVLNVTSGTLVNAGTITSEGGTSAGGTLGAQLDNQGTVSANGSGAGTFLLSKASADHVSSGTINVSGTNMTVTQSTTTPSFTNSGAITIGSGRTMTVSGGSFVYNSGSSVTGGTSPANLALTSATATLNTDLTGADFIVTSSTVNGSGNLIVNTGRTLSLSAGTISVPLVNNGTTQATGGTAAANNVLGTYTSGAGSSLQVISPLSGGSGILTIAAGFTNNGSIVLYQVGARPTAVLNVTSGTLVNAGTITSEGGTSAGGTLGAQLDNQGTVSVNGSGAGTFLLSKASADHVSSGTINVSGTNMTVTQSGTTPSFTNSGAITIGSGRTMTVSGGSFVYNSGSSVTGGTSPANLALTSTSTATLNTDLTGADFIVTSSTVNGSGNLIVDTGRTLTLTAGTINVPLANNGRTQATGGTTAANNVNGTYTSGAGSMLQVTSPLSGGSGILTIAAGFTNNGSIVLFQVGARPTAVLNVTSGTLVNAGTITSEGGVTSGGTLGAQLDNQGTVSVNGSGAGTFLLSKASADHMSSGTINVSGTNMTVTQSGTTPSFTNSGAITIGGSRILTSTTGTFINAASGVIRGHGTLNIGTTFTNHGTMAPGTETTAGTLTVTGTYPQTVTGVLAINVGGLTATQHDRLNVSGPANLTGAIEATLINGFVPSPGNTFTVMTHGTRTGTFDNFANATGSCFEPNYLNPAAVTLEACACTPPVISSSPVSTAVCADHHSVLFAVIADGTAPLAYQWRKDGNDIPGANAATYSIGLATWADAGDYDVVVTNDCGQDVSTPAVLAILPEGPEITEQPAASTFCIGATATFEVGAEPHMGGALSYQWRKDGDPISGATASTLMVTVATLADGGQYDCVVSEAGCGSTTSTPGVLTVKNDPPVITLTGPAEVTIECPNAYVEPGASINDDCDTGLTVMIGGDQVADGEPGVYVVTYDATDSQGNPAAQVTRVVRVEDLTPPTISLDGPATMLLECHAEFVDPGTTAQDACDSEPTVLVGGDALDPNVPGSYVLTYRAVDDAGNESPAVSRTIEVQDTISPTITLAGDATVTVECAAGYEELGATVEDACDPTVEVTIGGDVVDATTPDTYVVTYSATDAAGNPATASRTVEVVDSTPPTLTVASTPIVVLDADCSGGEVVGLPVATAEDLCDATPTVTHDAPTAFALGTTQVTYTARDDAGNETTATVDVTVQSGARIAVEAAQHTVGQGTRPSTTKAPLSGILVRAYERGPGSCIDQQAPSGASWQDYPAIVANCTPVNTGTTDATGRAVIDLPPGDYVIISHLAGGDTYIGEWANNLGCGETMTKRLQLIVANNIARPGKTTRLTGSELLIIEPEYVIWDDSTQVYPFVLESVGNWGVTASVAPPDGFVADHSSLSAQVQSEIEAVQFTITEVGSDLVPTRTTFQVIHGNRRHTVRSEVGLLLTPDYARARGFDVAALEDQGLIVHPGRHGGGVRGRIAGAPEETVAQQVSQDQPKAPGSADGSGGADSDAEGSGAAADADATATTAGGKSDPTWTAASVPPVISGRGLAAWPSPFSGNGALQVAFGLPDGSLPPDLELGLFDVLGRRVAVIPTDLAIGRDGVARLAWDADELRRGDVAPGVYFLQALAPSVGMRAECKLVVTR